MAEKPHALIIGGTSGLGLELARLLKKDYLVTITGRHNPQEEDMHFVYLNIHPREPIHRSLERCMADIA